MIGIIDYRMGNLRSVQKAFEHLGAEAVVLSVPAEAAGMDRLVLPGVGAFADGMTHLRDLGWVGAIHRFIDSSRPFLGICLGMQLLFEQSEEDAPSVDEPVAGLGVLPGRVARLPGGTAGGRRLKVPHMGWNQLTWTRPDPLLEGLPRSCEADGMPAASVYFVHSYYVEAGAIDGADVASAWCDYGRPFCASVWHGRIWATQFHPEKSQRVGLAMLASFTRV